jgi:hypothetical protein
MMLVHESNEEFTDFCLLLQFYGLQHGVDPAGLP